MKTPTIPTLLGPDGMTSLREYAGYHGGGSGFEGSCGRGTHRVKVWMQPCCPTLPVAMPAQTIWYAITAMPPTPSSCIRIISSDLFFRLSHRPSWRYLGIGEEEARAFSREVEAAWKEFAEDDCCCIDVERKRTFTMMIREGVAMHAFNGELFVQATGIPVPRDCSGHSSGWSARSVSATRTIPATAGTAVPVCRLMTAARRWDITSARTGIRLDAAEMDMDAP